MSCEEEAARSSLNCILTYNHNELDTILNYAAVTLCVVPIIAALEFLPDRFGLKKHIWLPVVIGLFTFQVYILHNYLASTEY